MKERKREREEEKEEKKKKKKIGQSCLLGSSKSISLVHCLHCQGKLLSQALKSSLNTRLSMI